MRLAWLLAAAVAAHAAVTTSFDTGWRFLKADAPGAESPALDDSAWHPVDLPHDWSIAGPFDPQNPTRGAGGFLPAGIGWYRKHFTIPTADRGRRIFIDFDGIMANSDVWINGFHLGRRPSGYVSFRYELTGHILFGRPNVIAVRADNSGQPASRWYAGAGIYRHVRLAVADPLHLAHWATFVRTEGANVRVATTVVNQGDTARTVAVEVSLLAPNGATVTAARTQPRSIAPGQSADFELPLAIDSPQRWDLDRPALYQAKVKAGADEETVPFGIRNFRFDPATGFWLNGRNLKIKGVCLHGDAGGLGVAVPVRAWERRLERLKQLGVNAIRAAHNPPAPEFLDLCDRLGFLVMDEMFDAWTIAKLPYDYHLYFREWSQRDTADTVRRDRNHPSIVLYSAGNEIRDTPKADLAKEILRGLVDVFHANDPTRPVTQALFRPNVSHDYDDGLADLLDVIGQNYRENEILAAHESKPSRKILGTENQHDRRVWLALRDNPPYAGQFLWSGIDYLGESRAWPVVGAGSGLLDRTGGFKPIAYERQSWWSDRPMVYLARRVAPRRAGPTDPGYETGPVTAVRFPQALFPDWTPADSAPHDENVEAYSNCEQVELLLNGKSLGSQPLPADASPRVWRVPYQPGTLRAIGRNHGQVAATFELRTAGKPAKVVLSVDRPRLRVDWDDVAYVTATVVDSNGVPVPDGAQLITFQLDGPGAIAAVDNADNASHEPFQASQRQAYRGSCVAVVRATGAGRIILAASAQDLTGSTVTLEAHLALAKIPPDTLYDASRGYGYEAPAVQPPYFFSVRVPEEGNYKVTATFGDPHAATVTTVKAELRRLMLEKVRTSPGEFVTRTFIVNIRRPQIPGGGEVRLKPREAAAEAWAWDDKLTLEFTNSRPGVAALDIEPVDVPTLYIAGDSTSTDQPLEPYNSWGQMLPRFFQPAIAVANHGESGESLRSFIAEHRLEKLVSLLKPGDWLFIQMGHNDQKERGEGVGAFTTYRAGLKRFIAAARQRGAAPVLITSVNRLSWGPDGTIVNSLGDYPEAVRRTAQEEQVPLIDLNAMSKVLYEAIGPATLPKAFADGDKTHHNNYGSYELAKCVVEGIRRARLPLAKYLADDVPAFDPAHPDPIDRFDIPAEPRGPLLKPYGN